MRAVQLVCSFPRDSGWTPSLEQPSASDIELSSQTHLIGSLQAAWLMITAAWTRFLISRHHFSYNFELGNFRPKITPRSCAQSLHTGPGEVPFHTSNIWDRVPCTEFI
ncbi:hypothetical protein M413DRAFT_442282 [Hebeloma cylindrosporum]|uniref:Uncharacterized protein n=1 Tax=Hebeloma cylindrosporum TaxID=76867 RepID=A0A0C2YXF3_HEBCY|nr:hypothetical protein M413DRAFT_442282 [Hebeloma cylindrosporum h7]